MHFVTAQGKGRKLIISVSVVVPLVVFFIYVAKEVFLYEILWLESSDWNLVTEFLQWHVSDSPVSKFRQKKIVIVS